MTLLVALAGLMAGVPVRARTLPAFTLQEAYPSEYAAPVAVVLADLDEDGNLDVLLSEGPANVLSFRFGDGTGILQWPGSIYLDRRPGRIAVGHLDTDAHPDLAVALPDWNYVLTFLGQGYANFGSARITYTHSYTQDVAFGDFDGVPGGDLAVPTAEHSGVDILTSDPGGFLSLVSWPTAGTLPVAARCGDLDHDGRQDVVVANSGAHTVSVLRGNGDGTFHPKVDHAVGSDGPVAAALGDVDGDGHLDVVVAAASSAGVSLLRGRGDGTLQAATPILAGVTATALALADLDVDGRLDIVVAEPGANLLWVLIADGAGGFASPVQVAVDAEPVDVAVGDLDGNGMPDLVIADRAAAQIVVALQTTPLPTSTTTLEVSPAAPVYRAPLQLTAHVEPATATGTVVFYDADQRLGTAPVSDGAAALALPDPDLLHGIHRLTARYRGSAIAGPSLSDTLELLVGLGLTRVTVTASAESTARLFPVTFTARVEAVAPSRGVPVGLVQFRVDGVDLDYLRQMSNGIAISSTISSLTIGTHRVEAVYQPWDTLGYAGSTSPPYAHRVVTSDPVIAQVTDVAHDQGGFVQVSWRCVLDQPGYTQVKGYRVWRRLPLTWRAGTRSGEDGRAVRVAREVRADSSVMETYWEALADLPAARLVSYGYTAATTQDSMAGGNPHTAFAIQALTVYDEFRASPPDSGYSVDNLAPPAPWPFNAVYSEATTALHWRPSHAPDLSHYRLHRGATPDFVPGPANLVTSTPDTGFVDRSMVGLRHYKLAAVDVHGNVGRYVVVSPDDPTAALATLVSATVDAGTARLRWYVSIDEPAVITVHRCTLTSGWAPVATRTPDGVGYVGFEEDGLVAGMRYGYRLGVRTLDGVESFSETVWLDVPLTAADLAITVPNPVAGGDVTASFAAPAGPPTRVELIDVSGRVVATREVIGGVGRQSVSLANARALAPGLYLIRIGLASPRVMRVVVIR